MLLPQRDELASLEYIDHPLAETRRVQASSDFVGHEVRKEPDKGITGEVARFGRLASRYQQLPLDRAVHPVPELGCQ